MGHPLPTFDWAHRQKFPETERSVSKWVPESVDLVVMHDDQRVWNNSLVHYALDSVSKIKISLIHLYLNMDGRVAISQ